MVHSSVESLHRGGVVAALLLKILSNKIHVLIIYRLWNSIIYSDCAQIPVVLAVVNLSASTSSMM